MTKKRRGAPFNLQGICPRGQLFFISTWLGSALKIVDYIRTVLENVEDGGPTALKTVAQHQYYIGLMSLTCIHVYTAYCVFKLSNVSLLNRIGDLLSW